MTAGGVTRVVLADDHAMVREALSQILEESGSIRVVGQAADGAQVHEIVSRTHPDLLVLDYSMPSFNAPSAIESLLRRHPHLKILLLTVHENIHYAVKVLESGAHGYVVKSAAVGELVDAIKAVADGEIYISPKVSQRVIHHLRRPKKDRVGLEALSQREFDLLLFLARHPGQAFTRDQLMERVWQYTFYIDTSTVTVHIRRLRAKLEPDPTHPRFIETVWGVGYRFAP